MFDKRNNIVLTTALSAMLLTSCGSLQNEIKPDDPLLDIGYESVRRSRHAGAPVNLITAEDLKNAPRSHILDALKGLVPGLEINRVNGERDVRIRGTHSIFGSNTPLYIVDGSICPSLDFISVDDVAEVHVLKDGSIYGSQGANGAIIIHTKR